MDKEHYSLESNLKRDLNISITQKRPLYKDRLHHYWYGGDVMDVSVSHKKDGLDSITYNVTIRANGDMEGWMIDKDNNIRERIKDRSNMGEFTVFSKYLRNDGDIELYVERYKSQDVITDYQIILDYCNEWEIVTSDTPFGSGEFYEISLYSYTIKQAVLETIINLVRFIQDVRDVDITTDIFYEYAKRLVDSHFTNDIEYTDLV